MINAGERYRSGLGLTLDIHRVAKDGAWADVTVTDPGGTSWRKRQRLRDGTFPFGVQRVEKGVPA